MVRTEDRSQRTEVRSQKTEVRGQKSEVRGQKTEGRSQRRETGLHPLFSPVSSLFCFLSSVFCLLSSVLCLLSSVFCPLSLLVLLHGCTQAIPFNEERTGETAAEEYVDAEAEYRILPHDTLDIQVYPDEDLKREISVSAEGKIQFPLIGEIQAAGLTIPQLEKKMTRLFAKDYFVNPQVHVRIKKFHEMSVSVLGEVKNPGTYRVESEEEELTVLKVIALAGGFTDIANLKKVQLVRVERAGKRTYRINVEDIIQGRRKDIRLRANDVIVVPQSFF